MNIERHYLKCTYCERPISINCSYDDVDAVLKLPCPLCNEVALRYMGQVKNTDIVRKGVKAACDLRCTNAVGPKCDCVCGNENHGTHKLVTYDRVFKKLAVVNADMLNNNENYLARIKRMATTKNAIKVKVLAFLEYKFHEVLDAKRKGILYDLPYEKSKNYWTYKTYMNKIDKIEDLTSIQQKVNRLAKMIPQIGTTLEYLEALYTKKEQKEAQVAA